MAALVARPLRAAAAELTGVAPARTLPDWFGGDPAHATGPSDHNPDESGRPEQRDADDRDDVRGWDIRLPLNASFSGEDLVQFVVREARAGRLPWLRYVIFRRRIWTRSSDWVTRVYTGANPHDTHIHISSLASWDDRQPAPLGLANLVEATMALTEQSIADAVASRVLGDGGMRFLMARGYEIKTGGAHTFSPDGEPNVLHAKLDAILAAVLQVDEEVVARLGAPELSAEQMAEILCRLPGVHGRESEVAAALAARAGQ